MNYNIFNSLFRTIRGEIPGQMVIQVTNHCNGACPQCGMRKSSNIQRCSLTVDKIKNTVLECAENGFEAVSFTGGEPFLYIEQLLDLLSFASKTNVSYTRTGTNGYMLANTNITKIEGFIKKLSSTKIRNFWISLDSACTDTHERMRGLPGVIEGIKRALPIFHSYNIYPAANLGINRNILGEPVAVLNGQEDESRFYESFKEGFTAFFQKAIDMGFTMTNLCYPMSNSNEDLDKPVYGAISDDLVVSFSKKELKLIFKALLEVIPKFRDKIRIFSPLSVLYAMSLDDDKMLFPCFGGIRYFYMDSRDGNVYPCGFLGDDNKGETLSEALEKAENHMPDCTKCHWECFRDPSQLFGIGLHILKHPIKTLIKKELDPIMVKYWFEDMKYYNRNNFFDGRSAPK